MTTSSDTSVTTVSIIGTGNMGLGMLRNLRSKGWQVASFDISEAANRQAAAAGARVCGSALACAQAANCVIVCVVDGAQTQAVLQSITREPAPQTRCVMLCSTLAPQDVERFAQLLASASIECIDAPMSGGPARATDGTMSLMLACTDEAYERHAALIRALSDRVHRISAKAGDAARTKLVNNLLAAINLAGAAECMALAHTLGLNLQTTLAVIEQSSGQSWIGSDRLRRAIAGDYAPRAHTRLLNKDSHLALAMAEQVGFHAPLGIVSAQLFKAACDSGLDAEDDASVFKHAVSQLKA